MKKTKRVWSRAAAGLLCATMVATTISFVPTSAVGGVSTTQIPYTIVDSIYNANPTGAKMYQIGSGGNALQFNMLKPGKVRVNLSGVSAVSKDGYDSQIIFTLAYAPTGLSSAADIMTQAIVLDQKTLQSGENSYLGYNGSEFAGLNTGTYYLVAQTPKDFLSGHYSAGLEVEEGVAEENLSPSSRKNMNTVAEGQTVKGFIANTDALDYYTFHIDKDSLAGVSYRFDSRDTSGYFRLYDANTNEQLVGQDFEGNFVWNTSYYYLKAGDYYATLQSDSGVGDTEIKYTTQQYACKLVPANTNPTNQDVVVKVDTNISAKQIEAVPRRIDNNNLDNDEVWENGLEVSADQSFAVEKNGIYSVRVTDYYGTHVLAGIEINNIDKEAPAKPVITSFGSKTVTGNTEPGATVQISIEKAGTFTGQADANGNFTVNVGKRAGNTKATIVAIDSVGNKSGELDIYSKPAKPSVTEKEPEGKTVEVLTSSGAFAYVTYKRKTYSAQADDKGTASISLGKKLVPGTKFKVYTKSQDGKFKSKTVTAIVAPGKPVVTSASAKKKVIKGKTLKKATVYVKYKKKTYKTKANKKGKFTIKIKKAKESESYTIWAKNAGGKGIEENDYFEK